MNIKTERIQTRDGSFYFLSTLILDDGVKILAEDEDRTESRIAVISMAAHRNVYGDQNDH